MSTTTEPHDAIGGLRSVGGEEPGTDPWQRLVLALKLGVYFHDGRAADIDGLARAIDVPIRVLSDMPIPSTSYRSGGRWVIAVSDALNCAEQLHHALHQLKHIVDHPSPHQAQHTAAFREEQAELFANFVLAIQGRLTGAA